MNSLYERICCLTLISVILAGSSVPFLPQIIAQEATDEFGNPLTTPEDSVTATPEQGQGQQEQQVPLQPEGSATTTTQAEICDNFVDDDTDGFMDSEDLEGCNPQGTGTEGGVVPPPEAPTIRVQGHSRQYRYLQLYGCVFLYNPGDHLYGQHQRMFSFAATHLSPAALHLYPGKNRVHRKNSAKQHAKPNVAPFH